MSATSDVNCLIVPVSRWRRWLVGGLAAGLLLGHGYDIVTQTEHWPFSFYPMYGRVQRKPRLSVLELVGVMQEGSKVRSEHVTSPAYLPPLLEVHMRNILMLSWGTDGSGRTAARDTAKILSDYLHAYEGRRIAGLHKGPPMVEAQLCQATYLLRPDANNQKAHSITPLIGVSLDGAVHRYATPTTEPAKPLDLPGDDVDRRD